MERVYFILKLACTPWWREAKVGTQGRNVELKLKLRPWKNAAYRLPRSAVLRDTLTFYLAGLSMCICKCLNLWVQNPMESEEGIRLQLPTCNLYRLSQGHFPFPSWDCQSISPTGLTPALSKSSPQAWPGYFIISHLHWLSATQRINFFPTDSSSSWLLLHHP